MRKLACIIYSILLNIFILNGQVPYLKMQDVNGKSYVLSDYIKQNKYNLVSLWAKWCPPCLYEQFLWKNYCNSWLKDYNIKISSIHLNDSNNTFEQAKMMWNSEGFCGDLFGSIADSVISAYKLTGIPQIFIYDSNGKILYSHSGFDKGDEILLNEFISNLFPVKASNIINSTIANIYPNPFSDYITIELFENIIDPIYYCDIHNSIGNLVYSNEIKEPLQIINLSNLTKGIYTLEIKSLHSNITKVLIRE
ncbi:MAG: T9SS type A sorting domain-containing protein [Bacteroidota bacterium]|nr:T9SS type A sorting domain-containing protein [Bacteroidota bacterium]